MKKIIYTFLILSIILPVLSCDEARDFNLPKTNTSNFIDDNNIIFPVWTSVHEMYDVLFFLSPDEDTIIINNGVITDKNTFTSIRYEQNYTGNKNYRYIYFYANAAIIAEYEAVWWEYKPNKFTGRAACLGNEISFSLP